MKKIFNDDVQLGEYVADQIEELLIKKPDALICIAAGTSSLPVFDALIKRVRSGKISFCNASFVAMDEWLHFYIEEDGSMGSFLNKHFLQYVDFSDIFLFDGMAYDYNKECRQAEDFILKHGGIDYIIFGIGMNGHIALNEPGSQPQDGIRVVKVDNITAQVGLKYFDRKDVILSEGITLGIANALEARKVVLVANTASKYEIICKLEKTDPTPDLPATYLKLKDNFELLITKEAAGIK